MHTDVYARAYMHTYLSEPGNVERVEATCLFDITSHYKSEM